MKKILSFALVLALVLASVATCFAAAFSDLEGKDYAAQAQVLADVDVLHGYPDGTFGGDKTITRAEYVTSIVQALGFKPTAGRTAFKDVKTTDWFAPYVAYAAELGIAYGRTATVFAPADPVSYDEAIAFTTRALGYKDETLALSVSRALGLGMIAGLPTGSAPATRGDVAKLIYNAASMPIGTVLAAGWTANKEGKDTMFARLGATVVSELIDGTEPSAINLAAYAGKFVQAIYKNGKIVAVADAATTQLTGTYTDSVTFTLADGTKYTITAAAREQSLNPASSAAIYNGITEGIAAANYSNGKTVTLTCTLAGKNITNIYAAAQWVGTDELVVDATAAKKYVTATNAFWAGNLNASSAIDLTSFELVGVDSLDAITAGKVVTVYKNAANTKITKLAVGADPVTGVVEKIASTGLTVTINGTAYTAKASVLDSSAGVVESALAVGGTPSATATLYLNYAGKVAFAKKGVAAAAPAKNYAVLLDKFVPSNALVGETKAQLLLADGTKVVLDATATASKLAALKTALNSLSAENGAVVEYTLDDAGKLESIAPAKLAGYADTTFTVTKTNMIGSYKIAADALVLATSETLTATSGNAITLGTVGGITVNKVGTIAAGEYTGKDVFYHVNAKGQIDFLAYETTTLVDNTKVVGVYAGRSLVAKATDNVEYKFFVNGESKTYYGDGTAYDTSLAAGQFLAIEFFADGTVKDFAVVAEDGDTVSTVTYTELGTAALTKAATKASDDVIKFNGTDLYTLASPVVYAISATGVVSVIDVDTLAAKTTGNVALWSNNADAAVEIVFWSAL